MTYNRTLQGKFINGRYTFAVLILLTVILWTAGAFIDGAAPSAVSSLPLLSASNYLWVGRVISFLLYLITAFLLNAATPFEGHTAWQGGYFLLLVGINFPLHADVPMALSLFLMVLSMLLLFRCTKHDGVERDVYEAFFLLGLSAMIMPQLVLFVLPFVVYLSISKIFSARVLFSAFLGLSTPAWLLFGTIALFPAAEIMLIPLKSGFESIFLGLYSSFTPTLAGVLLLELFITLPAVVKLAGAPTMVKPHLRRVLTFVAVANIILWLAAWFLPDAFTALLVWRMPGMAALLTYSLTQKITKFSNIYFLFINTIYLGVLILELWRLYTI